MIGICSRKVRKRNRDRARERECSRTHLDRLEDIHARMPGVALLALVPGLARGALLAANAVESLCVKLLDT